MKCGCSIYCFLSSENLICRGMNISKYFRESLGLRDNEFETQPTVTESITIDETGPFIFYDVCELYISRMRA